MPRRIYHMPGQSMYAGAWDVLMLTFSVLCSMGLSLKPPAGGPAAVDAVAIVAVPAARPWVQARVVGVSAAADAINQEEATHRLPLSGCLTAWEALPCDWVLASRLAAGLHARMQITAMQQGTKNVVWVASRRELALQSCFALLCLWESPDSKSRYA